MKHQHFSRQMFWLLLLLPAFANAQGTPADYERAAGLREKFQGLVAGAPDRANWIEKSSRFWYRKAVKGGYEFVMADARLGPKNRRSIMKNSPPRSLESLPSGDEAITALRLPFNEITFVDGERAIEVNARGSRWRCDLAAYKCKSPTRRRSDASAGRRRRARTLNGIPGPRYNFPQSADAKVSPDGKWELMGKQFQRMGAGQRQAGRRRAELRRLGGKLLRDGFARLVARFEEVIATKTKCGPAISAKSNTWSRRQATSFSRIPRPTTTQSPATRSISRSLCSTSRPRSRSVVDNALFPNSLSHRAWNGARTAARSRSNTTSAGHQVYRVIEIDAAPGKVAPSSSRSRRRSSVIRTRSSATTSPTAVNDLDVGARRLESPLSLRRRDRQGEEPDHERANGSCAASKAWTRRSARSGSSASGMHPGQDPYLRPLLPDQLRRHRPHGADRGRRQSQVSSRRTEVLRRHLVARRSRPRSELRARPTAS